MVRLTETHTYLALSLWALDILKVISFDFDLRLVLAAKTFFFHFFFIFFFKKKQLLGGGLGGEGNVQHVVGYAQQIHIALVDAQRLTPFHQSGVGIFLFLQRKP